MVRLYHYEQKFKETNQKDKLKEIKKTKATIIAAYCLVFSVIVIELLFFS